MSLRMMLSLALEWGQSIKISSMYLFIQDGFEFSCCEERCFKVIKENICVGWCQFLSVGFAGKRKDVTF